jgi:hypothetical protein
MGGQNLNSDFGKPNCSTNNSDLYSDSDCKSVYIDPPLLYQLLRDLLHYQIFESICYTTPHMTEWKGYNLLNKNIS